MDLDDFIKLLQDDYEYEKFKKLAETFEDDRGAVFFQIGLWAFKNKPSEIISEFTKDLPGGLKQTLDSVNYFKLAVDTFFEELYDEIAKKMT